MAPDLTEPEVPPDVADWLAETYTPEGQAIWRKAYRAADDAGRARMVRIARTPSGGT